MGVDIPVTIELYADAKIAAPIRSGNRSLIFRTVWPEGVTRQFGAAVELIDRETIDPGQRGTAVLHCWQRTEAAPANRPGQRLVVWYGSDIGAATVLASMVSAEES